MQNLSQNKKCLAFDLGMVLFEFDYSIALRKMEDKLGVSCEEIMDALYNKDFAIDFEKGLLSGYEFYLKFKKAFAASLSYPEFVNAWCEIFNPNQEVIELTKRLKRIYPLYLISNISDMHFQYLYKKFPEIFSFFRKLILSFEVKSVKPEEKIYNELKKAANVPAENIIYIDDRPDLIEKAKKLNFICIKFKGIKSLLKELKERGIHI